MTALVTALRSMLKPVQKDATPAVEADPTDLEGFEVHQDGLALAFAEKHARTLRYCHTRKSSSSPPARQHPPLRRLIPNTRTPRDWDRAGSSQHAFVGTGNG
jgi:hypothetical protein